jgi:hypothetical protein
MEKISRSDREAETREAEARVSSWRPPSLLPLPLPQDGYKFRWVRTSVLGQEDNKNVSAKFRENWVPVKASDHPELQIVSDRKSTFTGNVEVGGLLLVKTPIENVEARNDYYAKKARDQLQAVDNHLLRQNDPRMPLLTPERRSKTSFGTGE